MSEKLLSTQNAAALLGLARETVAIYANNGTIPATKIGRRWRFQKSDLDDFIASQRGR